MKEHAERDLRIDWRASVRESTAHVAEIAVPYLFRILVRLAMLTATLMLAVLIVEDLWQDSTPEQITAAGLALVVLTITWDLRASRRRSTGCVSSAVRPLGRFAEDSHEERNACGERLTDAELRVIAWHEAGHALVAWLLPDAADPSEIMLCTLRSSSIGGRVSCWIDTPLNRLSPTRAVFASVVFSVAGRSAEFELLEGDTSTGAADDMKQARSLAGWLAHSHAVFGARSCATAAEVMRAAIADADADALLATHRHELELLAGALLDRMAGTGEDVAWHGQIGITGDELAALHALTLRRVP